MSENKTKYLAIGIISVILISVFFIGVNLFKRETKEIKEKTISREETRSMLSYTLDGEKTDIKPTKEDGYIANKIICENGSNLIWDNTNWEVEIISLESNDVCSVDFTTNENTNGYRVTATTNVEGSIDSLSKATIENGTIIFYPNKGKEITGVSGCSNGKLENNKVIVSNVTSNQTCNINVKLPIKNLYTLLSDGSKYKVGERTDFSTVFGGTTIQDGYNQTGKIYLAENNYYFAGNPSDNWVLFANKWWRIIRSNSIEGTRLLYAGDTPNSKLGCINNGSSCTTYQWNNMNNGAIYVEWSNYASTIRSALDSWYSSNISSYENMINTDTIYCNDTSVARTSGSYQYFGAYGRLVDAKTPNYTCGTNGNTTHKKIGLMTVDEVAYAGGVYVTNAPNTYYYRNSVESGCTGSSGDPCSVTGDNTWWTMNPWGLNSGSACIFNVTAGQFGLTYVNYSNAIRPVITLLPSVEVSGSGTTDDPFIPSLD